jgi:hypothetical protein
MTGNEENDDRRRHERLEVDGATFVVLRPDNTRVGQVMDIGLGGLAFRYMTGGEPWTGAAVLDLFVVGHDFYLDDVAFHTIWDFATGQVAPWASGTMRRRGVQFQDLTLPQESQLVHFMEMEKGATQLIR